MATQTIVTTLDDLDGSEASTTVRFGLDGTDYEIDLSDNNRDKLYRALDAYVSAGRKLGRANGQRRAVHYVRQHVGPDNSAVRAWAKSRGIEVSDRGRLSAHLVEQFEQAQREPVKAPEPEVPAVEFTEPEAKPKAAPRKRAPRKVAAATK